MNISEFLEKHYWPEHALTLRRASYEQLRFSVLALERHLGRPPTLDDFERLKVLGFLAARQARVSAATVNKDRRSLLCLWRNAAELQLCPWPPRLPKAKQPMQVPHTFTQEQIHRLVQATSKMPDHAFWRSLILALYDSGARISAMLAVQICDVRFAEQEISLSAAHSKTLTGQVVAIAADTSAAVAAQVLGRDRDELVWPWPHHHRRLFIHFRKLATLADVTLPKGKVFHSLRRTTATLIASDLGLESAARQLGHSSVAVTKRYIDAGRLAQIRWLPPRP